MVKTVFAGGFVWDGMADHRVTADVLVEGDRIVTVGAIAPRQAEDARRIDATGATLIPGMVDAHGASGLPGSHLRL